jgi:2-polyprenyl-3-methyl-5-hydroxy-6-metoxy-1,4-benzoquinol methylase
MTIQADPAPLQATSRKSIVPSCVVCPVCHSELNVKEEAISCSAGHQFKVEDQILRLFVKEEDDDSDPEQVTSDVSEFYEHTPFPNYNSFDTLNTFIARAQNSVFADMLRQDIPIGAKVLEVGCGTGQLSNYLAATGMCEVIGSDMSMNSLRLGSKFASANDIPGINFMQMNLFRPSLQENSIDIVISNGVLHHTYDAKKAFMSVSKLVKPGGYFLVGLYNTIGRLSTDARRMLRRIIGDQALYFDSVLRRSLDPEKRRAWIADQYDHPHETKHSISEVLEWFDEAGFSFVSSIPSVSQGLQLLPGDSLFTPQDPGSRIERFYTELGLLAMSGNEGGLFIMIGRKNS